MTIHKLRIHGNMVIEGKMDVDELLTGKEAEDLVRETIASIYLPGSDRPGKIEAGIAVFRQLSRICPNATGALDHLAHALMWTKEYAQVEELLDRALELKPISASFLANRAYCRYKLDKIEGAIEDYRRSLEIEPNGEENWFSLGLLLARDGEPHEVLHCMDKALELDDENPRFWLRKALYLAKLGRKKESQDCIEHAYELEPYYVESEMAEAEEMKDLYEGVVLPELPKRDVSRKEESENGGKK